MMPVPNQRQAMPQAGASNPIDQNRSALNPTDMAYMKSSMGGQEPSVGEFITNVLRVPLEAPLSAMVDALKKQSENARMGGKMKNMAMGGRPQMGQGSPMGMQAGRRPPGLGAMGANAPAPGGGGPPGDLGSLLSSIRPQQ